MYKNITNIPLAVAVWLAHDDYDHNPDTNTISATSLIKPLKQVILGMRVPIDEEDTDIASQVASSVGTAVHTSIEQAWLTNYKKSMADLGYPTKMIDKIVINPDEVLPGQIPVYLERRSKKEVNGITISGKFDFVAEGRVQDFKTTKTYTYIAKTNDKKYIQQMSIYAWLNPDIITGTDFSIHFIFTDWTAMQAKVNKKYPQSQILEYKLQLMPLQETERFVTNKINEIKKYINAPEEELTPCNDEDLWRRDPVWKYYKDPNKTTRSTKNFDNAYEAHARLAADGSVGSVVEVKGEVIACKYCNALNICKQKNEYILNETLKF